MFSSTTIASSTTRPTARTNPNNINKFIENPMPASIVKTPINETGIAQKGTNAALAVPRNRYVTADTRIIARIIASTTSLIDSLTNSVTSY